MLSFGLSGGLSFFTLLLVLMFRLSRSGLDPAIVGQFSWAGLPYTMRCLWPFVIDHVPVPGRNYWGRRKAWGLWAHFFSMVGFLLMGALSPASPLPLLFGVTCITAFFSSVQDIVSDACRFEPQRILPLKDSVAFQTLGFRCGQFLASSIIPMLASFTGWFGAHLSVVIVKILALLALLKLPEPSVFAPKDQRKTSASPSSPQSDASNSSLPTPKALLLQVVHKPHVLPFLASLVFLRAIDTLLGPLQTIFFGQLGLSNHQFGFMKNGLGFAATLTGVVLARKLIDRIPLLKLLRLGALIESGVLLLSLFLLRLSPTDPSFPYVFCSIALAQELCLGLMNTLIVLYISSFSERFVGLYHYTLFSAFGSLVRTLGTAGFSFLQGSLGWAGLFVLPLAFALVLQGILGRLSKNR